MMLTHLTLSTLKTYLSQLTKVQFQRKQEEMLVLRIVARIGDAAITLQGG